MEEKNARLKMIDSKTDEIINKIKEIRPDVVFENNKLIYYIPYVNRGQLILSKQDRPIYIKDDPVKLARGKFFTKKEATDAITPSFDLAKIKFKNCLDRFNALKNELEFSVSYTYDGDTHGIFDEYSYISFKIDGFDFSFEINT